jgi:hypothetical protein
MGANIQAFDIFQTPLSSHYPLPLRCLKIAMIQVLPMQMMQNIYILMVSCEINDATYTVDSARADGYKRCAEPRLILSQLEDFKEASAPVKRTRRTRSWPHYPL